MEISIKIICYIYLVQAMTIVIEILWGNSIVYLLKSKKGKKLTAQIVELNCLFRAQRDIDVSVLEYNNMLYALPYKDEMYKYALKLDNDNLNEYSKIIYNLFGFSIILKILSALLKFSFIESNIFINLFSNFI